MNSFTRFSVQVLRADLEAAFKQVADKHNLIIGFDGNARFNPSSCSFSKITAVPKAPPTLQQNNLTSISPTATSQGIDPYNTLESREYLNLGYIHGLPKDWLGKKFKTATGTYTLVGLKNSFRKYPVIGISARGTRYKFSSGSVKVGIIQ
jgi:hypothetical protein